MAVVPMAVPNDKHSLGYSPNKLNYSTTCHGACLTLYTPFGGGSPTIGAPILWTVGMAQMSYKPGETIA